MKKYLLTTLLGALIGVSGFSQSTIPNADLESWTNSGNYDQPNGGYWATANKIVDLLPGFYPATTLKTTDAHSGMYAAKLETKKVSPPVNLLVTGTLATGVFDENGTPPDNLKLGQPFTGRPDKFTGWYKFTSVNSDSSDIYCLLSKWNTTTASRDTISYVGMRLFTTVSAYTQWDLPFSYTNTDSPDSISIVFASSSDGKNFNGQVGNSLFIDDVALETATGLEFMLMPEVGVTVFPNPSTDLVRFGFSRDLRAGSLEILDLNGKSIARESFTGNEVKVNVSNFAAGTYFFRAWDGEEKLNTGTFVAGQK